MIAIIAILAGMLLPALNQAREKARTSSCGNNIKQIMLSMTMYTDSHNGAIPPAHAGGKIFWQDLLYAGRFRYDRRTVGSLAVGEKCTGEALCTIRLPGCAQPETRGVRGRRRAALRNQRNL